MFEAFLSGKEEDADLTNDELEVASVLSEISSLADKLKQGLIRIPVEAVDRKELLDSLCDQVVTAIGVATYLKMDIVGALQEVSDSNWSKFVDGKPIRDENLKILKGPNYFKPSLDRFV